MSRKSKGCNAERELVHLFWGTGNWTAIRVAGSGSCKFPSPDILAGNSSRKLAIECKASKNNKYIPIDEINQLKEYSNLFGAEAWIAVKFDRQEWYFIKASELINVGKNYAVSKEFLVSKGIRFDELIR